MSQCGKVMAAARTASCWCPRPVSVLARPSGAAGLTAA